MDFVKPTIEYAELAPLLIVLGGACLGVLAEAFLPRERRRLVQVLLTAVVLLAALATTIWVATDLDEVADGAARGLLTAGGTIVVDGPTVYLWGLVLLLSLGGVALFAERRLEGGVSAFAGQAAALPGTDAEREVSTRGWEHTEIYPLMLFAVGGMMLFPASNDLLTMFVALEVLSLPLYLLCGLARRRRLLSQEAALKYFLLGAFSSGFFLYGVALVYGFAGSMEFAAIAEAVRNDTANQGLLLVGMGMLAVGLLFKVGAVPFHGWTPDVYQGAPTPLTAFMSAATKVAAFGALLRLFYVAFGADRWSWQPMMWVIAILTMLVGAIVAVAQTDVKRMLAYSSIAHTGFLLTGVLGVQASGELAEGQVTSLQAVLFYLATYGVATLGAFAVVTLVRDSNGEATQFDRWAGLGRRSPWLAGAFGLYLLSMAGIPLTAGFVGKWAVFTVAMSAGAWPVVLTAIASSIIAVFFYVRYIRIMFFAEPQGAAGAAPGELASVTTPSLLTSATIAAGVVATVVLGVVPGPVLDLAARAGDFIR
ncbi:NADH-quinone oxidoreductase subunit NuoN [Nocardioides marmotae]|uniref:NADH-quinone oxidoreductase subunit N n=1 Tax=Nocardioides marmotae TaxID=2663857 RepID=A0A6I3J953_9ACTN|nr:NADH-quinone oxidoreductase subunit NuoN [Nocardioides marmotae]MCR6030047.1 NADH-quinone oxidoreductase subunit NuoN [Gordonia jinghuaiqii]MBC9733004.1 NADH-quinone oxidoreductase subunit NuoN [Nocardioides marmotae]MTB84118.1 NADH-quinone oxidoreductase subunit NuoN [Nocardioides marmotae]MTB93678.1 NADH-quinone oxidoreductase subunit NuoN [Nocardioides marmotae]QKE00026.1 NADH-quinone oxidoreductase subunit NuoN [Nocardioides marmotae]